MGAQRVIRRPAYEVRGGGAPIVGTDPGVFRYKRNDERQRFIRDSSPLDFLSGELDCLTLPTGFLSTLRLGPSINFGRPRVTIGRESAPIFPPGKTAGSLPHSFGAGPPGVVPAGKGP